MTTHCQFYILYSLLFGDDSLHLTTSFWLEILPLECVFSFQVFSSDAQYGLHYESQSNHMNLHKYHLYQDQTCILLELCQHFSQNNLPYNSYSNPMSCSQCHFITILRFLHRSYYDLDDNFQRHPMTHCKSCYTFMSLFILFCSTHFQPYFLAIPRQKHITLKKDLCTLIFSQF